MPEFGLDLRHFQFVIAVVKFGSLRQAANALDVSQSTISRRIQSLEHGLGFALFDRDRKGARLTRAGDQFLKEAALGMKQLQRAAQAASATHRGIRGEIKIGVLALSAYGILNTALREFQRHHTKVKVLVHEGTARENLHRLTLGALDIALLVGDIDLTGFFSERLWNEGVYIVLPASHKLAARAELNWDELRSETFLVDGGGPGPDMQIYLLKKLGAVGFQPNIDMHDVSREGLMHLVAMGYGLTLTGSSTIGDSTTGVVFRRIADGGEEISTNAIWSSSNSNPSVKLFLNLTKAVVKRHKAASK